MVVSQTTTFKTLIFTLMESDEFRGRFGVEFATLNK